MLLTGLIVLLLGDNTVTVSVLNFAGDVLYIMTGFLEKGDKCVLIWFISTCYTFWGLKPQNVLFINL